MIEAVYAQAAAPAAPSAQEQMLHNIAALEAVFKSAKSGKIEQV